MQMQRCLHLDSTQTICTERRAYQNCCCPYEDSYGKCKCYIPVTEKMEKQLKEKGYIKVELKER